MTSCQFANKAVAYFTLPVAFLPSDYLPFRMRRHHDAARWFVSTILNKLIRQRDSECVRLHAPFLKKMMGDRYRQIIGALLKGAVTRVPYQIGSSFGYSLAERFAYDQHVRVPVTDEIMAKRIQRQRDRAVERASERFLPIHFKLATHQHKLSIDGYAARDCLSRLPAKCNRFDAQAIQIRDIEEGQWRLTVGRWGRVQNNITSLKRELREHLRLEGERLSELDLVAAQPALLALLIQVNQYSAQFTKSPKHRRGWGWPRCLVLPRSLVCSLAPDFACFRKTVLTDDLYERLADAASVRRVEAKRLFLVDVLAKRGTYPSSFEDAFAREYPSVHGFFRAVNRDDHATLIRLLQRLESWLVIEQVCDRLDAPVLTLHDGVFARPADMPIVERAFSDVLQTLEFPMRWRTNLTAIESPTVSAGVTQAKRKLP